MGIVLQKRLVKGMLSPNARYSVAHSTNGDPDFGPSGLLSPEPKPRVGDHWVQFYSEDDFLLQTLQRFIGGALGSGDAAVVIASASHRRALAKRLKWCGVDLQLLQNTGRYCELDAETVLSSLDGRARAAAFEDLLETTVLRAGNLSVFDHSHTVVFGEVVGLMWERNRFDEAVALEEMWNRSVETKKFSLFCAYPVRSFSTFHLKRFSEVCVAHGGVISNDCRVALTSESQRRFPVGSKEQDAHKWRPLYQTAVWETDRQRSFRKVEVAEAAILSQLEAAEMTSTIQQELLDALATLLILKKHRLGFG
jgi:hypothetical protein